MNETNPAETRTTRRRLVRMVEHSFTRFGLLFNEESLLKWDERSRLYNARTYRSSQELKTSQLLKVPTDQMTSAKPLSAPPPSVSDSQLEPFDQLQDGNRHVYHVTADVHTEGSTTAIGQQQPVHLLKHGGLSIIHHREQQGSRIRSTSEGQTLIAQPPLVTTHSSTQTSSIWSPDPVASSVFKMAVKRNYFPHFTLWVSLVQVIVYVTAIPLFGMSSFGPGDNKRVLGRVLMPNLVVDHVCRTESRSILLAQRQADLIRLGARFPPCMRADPQFTRHVVERQKRWDRESGCCVRNDGGGCHQTRRGGCSHLLSTWLRYDADYRTADEMRQTHVESESDQSSEVVQNGVLNASSATSEPELTKRSGPVCGLDPAFCLSPRSSGAFTWSETDVTKWPICKVPINRSSLARFAPHMECKVTGRPCCVGMTGECIITTLEHCDFVRGIFNPKAALCSQVNCLEQTCGMWGFADHQSPDQGYRVFFSLFLHTNLLHLLLSLLIQLVALRPFEEYMGWHKMAIIFVTSGVFGNYFSSFVHPYQIATGPAHMGLLTMRLIDFLFFQHLLEKSQSGIVNTVLPLICIFLLGFLPWLDNVSNLGSCVAAILLYFILVYHSPCAIRLICLFLLIGFFSAVCLLFYRGPIMRCEWCRHLTCAPLTPGLCDEFQVHAQTQLDCIPLNW